MGSKLLDYDAYLKTQTLFHPSDDGQKFTIETKQDVTALIERNKILYNDVDERAKFGKETFHQVASIPLNVYFSKGLQDPAALKRFLNDSENRAFRTRPGSV